MYVIESIEYTSAAPFVLPCTLSEAASLARLTAPSTLDDREDRIEGRAGGGVKALLKEERDLLASLARLEPLAPAADVRLAADAASAEG